MYEVNGFLNGQAATAFPDTGSDQNLLSLDYVRRNNIPIISGLECKTLIKSADGRLIPTIGQARLPWSFDDSQDDGHILVFHVLEHCVHDVLLGHPFLLETNTTTSNRIKRRTVHISSSSSTGAVYDIHAAAGLRSYQCMVDGRLAGKEVAALADTGAQVNIMSLSCAQAMGLKLDMTGHRGTFRFIDGNEAPSIASVNAMWTSSDNKQYNLKFEVLIGSLYDVILGQKHVYTTKALHGKKFDRILPTANSTAPFPSAPTAIEPVASTPHPLVGACHTVEGSDTKSPDTGTSKQSKVCAVGFKSPLAKAIQKAKRLSSKSHRNENPVPHLTHEVQEEINRRAAEENSISRPSYATTHSPGSLTLIPTTSKDSTGPTLMSVSTDDSVPITPSAPNTSAHFQPLPAPPVQAPSLQVNDQDESKVGTTILPYL
jgi:hypothetical protein